MGLSFTSPDVLAVLFGAVGYALWLVYRHVYRTPLRVLPGPPAPSWVYGNQKEIATMENFLQPDVWFQQYGRAFMDRDLFMSPRLWTLDPRAINHILTHHDDYPRPESNRKGVLELLGRGLLFVQGEEHRHQRRVLNPAFGPAQIRDVNEIFVKKSIELRNLWASAIRRGADREITMNVNEDISRMTLDVIGLAGFGYDFNTLNPEGKPNELSVAFHQLFSTTPSLSAVAPLLRTLLPILKLIPNKRVRIIQHSSEVMQRVGMELVAQKKAAIVREMAEKHLDGIQRKDLPGRDILTVLIRANMAKDVPESQRLSDADVLGQIPTFLVAGHVTTSTTATWALYALSRHPVVQKKLREELLTLDTETPTMDELNSLPYLDAVLREVLRLHAPISMLVRAAERDDVIPLSKPVVNRYGKEHSEIRIAKGDHVAIPVLAMQRSKEIWGDDAMEFRPERWEQPPEAVSAYPGVWSRLLTFIGGPRACIGYRFSLVETKALLFTLVRAFEFALAVPAEDIVVKSTPLQRPSLRSKPKEGSQLPLLIKPYKSA